MGWVSTECLTSIPDTMTLSQIAVLRTSWSLALSSEVDNHIYENVKGINETMTIIGVSLCWFLLYRNSLISCISYCKLKARQFTGKFINCSFLTHLIAQHDEGCIVFIPKYERHRTQRDLIVSSGTDSLKCSLCWSQSVSCKLLSLR